jgi:nitrilase
VKLAIAQIAPVFLRREQTLEKVVTRIREAADSGCRLVAFGETLVPAYPLWLSRTDGAAFDSPLQKHLHALYLRESVCLDEGHLAGVVEAASAARVAVILGVAECSRSRGYSIFCSRIFIGEQPSGGWGILSVHRKLMPTYEERLAWTLGDGAGLVTHRVGEFTVAALNCWENWMPLARAALYAAGEDLHVMLWPGSQRLTRDITRFVALEARSFVVSACAIVRERDLPPDLPERSRIATPGEILYDGGSCIAAPDGSWLVPPQLGEEQLIVADIDHTRVLEERQNFDPAGHYARPDVLRLLVDRRRQNAADEASPDH